MDFYEANFTQADFTELLAISSLNGNGYVRQKATQRLAEIARPRAILFLVFRLADWVSQVRTEALNGLENYKSIEYIDILIENLPIFNWLQKVERTNLSGVHEEIVDFIVNTNRPYVIANFARYPDSIRLLIGQYIAKSMLNVAQELKLLLADRHFLIRSLAVDHFTNLDDQDVLNLLKDKSAKIRLRMLHQLKTRKDFENIAFDFIADESATIRHFSRFLLQDKVKDFADIYQENLKMGKQIVGSLAGLSDLDAKQYAGEVTTFLNHRKIKIKKAAFLASRKLDEKSAYQFALAHLGSDQIGIRNLAVEYLASFSSMEVLAKARTLYKMGEPGLRRSMLNLFSKIGGWLVVPDLAMGTIDHDEALRGLAQQAISTWRNKAITLYSSPNPDESERAKQVFEYVNEVHNTNSYFKSNPIEGLDFYFKS